VYVVFVPFPSVSEVLLPLASYVAALVIELPPLKSDSVCEMTFPKIS